MNNRNYIAAFDLDKTILEINSSKLVVQVSRKNGIMNNRDFLNALIYSVMYKFNLSDPHKLVMSMALWLKGLKEEEIKSLINNKIVPDLRKHIRPVILEELNFHRNNGGKVILLSSAINHLCNPVAEILEMDDVICSEMEVSNGVFTGLPKGKLVFGKEKYERMSSYCTENKFPVDTAWYYGDAMTDRHILAGVGHAVCVSPEWALKRLARKNNWKIIK